MITSRKSHAFLIFLLLLIAGRLYPQNPGAVWMKYATPEEAGWSSEKLE